MIASRRYHSKIPPALFTRAHPVKETACSVQLYNIDKADRRYTTVARRDFNNFKLNKFDNPTKLSAKKMSTGVGALPVADVLLAPTTVELLNRALKAYPSNNLFGTRNGDRFDWVTYAEFGKLVTDTRKVLHHHGVGVNDKVALISNNRVEWATVMYATQGLGGQIVPMYEAQLEKDWKYIIENSDSKVIVAANSRISQIVSSYINKIGKVQSVICLDTADNDPIGYKHWLNKVANEPEVPVSSAVTADHLASIIYTSGTTGNPKGVELSHTNIVSDIRGTFAVDSDGLLFSRNLTSLAFLPWAHVYGQVNELQSLIALGAGIGIVPSREQILECLQLVKPSIMYSVPMLFNKVYDGVLKNMSQQSGLTQFLFKQALTTARTRNHKLEYGESVGPFLNAKHNFLDKLVLSKVRAKIGSNLTALVAGGAATSLPVLHFFEDIGIPILEGYGATETSPVITASGLAWKNRRLGCVGIPLPDVDVQIVDPESLAVLPNDTDGEIICAGPIVMTGYRNNQAANDEVFYYKNGKKYYRTGDLGRLVEGRFLKITGRIKEQFKLENGKFVVPAPLEDIYARGPFIAQSFLYGVNKVSTILLIVPNYVEIESWAKTNKRDDLLSLLPEKPADLTTIGKTPEQIEKLEKLFKDEDLIDKITKEIIRHGKRAKNYERPFKWLPLAVPFTQESQHMTPKMSLRRANVVKDYQPMIESMYNTSSHVGHMVQYKE